MTCLKLRRALVAACLGMLVLLAGYAASAQPAGPAVSHSALVETSAVAPGQTFRAAVTFSVDKPWHVNARHPLDEFLIPTLVTFPADGPFRVLRAAYPEAVMMTLSFSPEPLALYEGAFAIGIEAQAPADLAPGTHTLKGTLQYQACNDKMCAPPAEAAFSVEVTVAAAAGEQTAGFPRLNWDQAESLGESVAVEAGETAAPSEPAPASDDWRALAERFTVSGRLDGYADKAGFLAFVEAAETGKPAAGGIAGRGFFAMLLLVVFGGLLLNLTPCVLPLIPINVAIIGAGARAGSKTRGFLLGAAYGAGIALVYGALGLAVVLGVSSAFGAINSTVWFNGLIAALFVVLGVAMFDLIQIDFSRFQARLGMRGNENGSFPAALFMGGVSALLAGACVAPVVIYTILHAQDLYSQGHRAAVLLPFLLGAGMALPWPFLGAGLSFLPKPGKWMTWVKYGFGVFILGFAAHYGQLAWSLSGAPQATDGPAGGWTPSLEEGLRRALDEKKPVIVDFWATWCKNCSLMDKTILKDEEVLSRLEGYVKVKYQAENLTQSPAREITGHFQVLGLPTFIVLTPKE